MGILIVQDLIVAILLGIMPAFTTSSAGLISAAIYTLFKIIALFIVSSGVGRLLSNHLLPAINTRASTEIQGLSSVAVCFGFVQLSDLFGLPYELGCFIAGAVLMLPDECKTIQRIETVKDLFAGLFFASIGIHVFPNFMWEQAYLIILMTIMVILGKSFGTFIIMRYGFRYGVRTSVAIAVGLSQISEFAFLLASKAVACRIFAKETYYLMLAVTTLSLILTPLLWGCTKYVNSVRRISLDYPDHDKEDANADNEAFSFLNPFQEVLSGSRKQLIQRLPD